MKTKKYKVFIDTNVWFSAFYKSKVCSLLLKSLVTQKCEIVVSELVVDEIIRKIKIPDVLPLVIEYINQIKPTVVKNPKQLTSDLYRNLVDVKDLPILTSAIEYSCTYLVTGNIKDFNVKKIKTKMKLEVLLPSQMLQKLI